MRTEATLGGAPIAAPTPTATDHRSGSSGTKGFTGGSHRGAIYRQTSRQHTPTPRPGTPRPRRPPHNPQASNHHDEHAIHPDDLRDTLSLWLSLLTAPSAHPAPPPHALRGPHPHETPLPTTGWEAVQRARL